ncbi:uncharacterized protein [Montipora foliosa]|uniref:uncharacterized protein n=1 Tax=Montipora foliosa TaxID=591990 RepID=UPI0035F13687
MEPSLSSGCLFPLPLQCHISLLFLVNVVRTYGDFLSVQAPVTYVVAGKDLSLDCEINGTSLPSSQVSWKHEGAWLHNLTRRVGRKLQLVIPGITSEQYGIYQCGVFNFSSLNDYPLDANVTVLVGEFIRKPQCVSTGRVPPRTLLLWNTVENKQSDLRFTYNVLYCRNPSPQNQFCNRPPHGFSIFKHCLDLFTAMNPNGSNTIFTCNITLLVKALFPHLFNYTKPSVGRAAIHFVINFGNVQSDSYSPKIICKPLNSVKCTKPENIYVITEKRRTLSLMWNAPKDMRDFTSFLTYFLVITLGDTGKNKTIEFLGNYLHDMRRDFTKLRPYTLYHIYIACAISPLLGDATNGKFIGPFSYRTLEEEPSGYPYINANMTFNVHGEFRDVMVTWTLPTRETWNGIITRFVLQYWMSNNSMAAAEVKVPSSISNKTGNLTNLRLNQSYAVTIQMCTRVGCGPMSQSFYIPAITDPDQSAQTTPTREPDPKGTWNFSLIIGLSSGIILFLGCVVAAVYLWKRKLRKDRIRRERNPLWKLDTSPSPFYEMPYDGKGSGGEYVPMLASKTENSMQVKNSQSEALNPKVTEHDTSTNDENSVESSTPYV